MGRNDTWCAVSLPANLPALREKEIKMNRFFKTYVTITALFLITSLQADTISMKDGTVKEGATIVSLSADTIALKKDEKIAVSEVTAITFSAFKVAPVPFKLVLKDGTALCGLVKKKSGKSLVFRSVTLGDLKITKDQIAAYIYGTDITKNETKKDLPYFVENNGKVTECKKVIWADHKQIGTMTRKGLTKKDAGALKKLQISTYPTGQNILLRNGDVINSPADFSGDSFSFVLLGKKKLLSTKTIKLIKFK